MFVSTKIDSSGKKYINDLHQVFNELTIDQKLYNSVYGLRIIGWLTNYVGPIKHIELNIVDNKLNSHHFRLIIDKSTIIYVSLDNKKIKVNDIIPKQINDVFKCDSFNDENNDFMQDLEKINKAAYNLFNGTYSKISEIELKTRAKVLLNPVNKLFTEYLNKNRKRKTKCLFNWLFNEKNRFVLRLLKSKFTMYDFTKEYEAPTNYTIVFDNDIICVQFDNGFDFALKLKLNSGAIDKSFCLKYVTTFINIDQIFGTDFIKITGTIKPIGVKKPQVDDASTEIDNDDDDDDESTADNDYS
jgi:hypothetical protein